MVVVFWHELADNFSSWRFIILFTMVLMAGVFTVYVAAENISEVVTEVSSSYFTTDDTSTTFIFLKLYTTTSELISLSFLDFIIIFIPIVGIALGFDAINSDKNSGIMSRLLSLPIFRDAVINGKFLAGVVTMTIMLVSIVMLVAGIGIVKLGIFPSPEEIIRLMAFIAVSVVYGAFWLGLAMLFSILFWRVATSALASLAVWIFFAFFTYTIAGLIANILVPVDQQSTTQVLVRHAEVMITIVSMSPGTLFEEAAYILLSTRAMTMGQLLQLQTSGLADWMLPNPLPLTQCVLVVLPQIVKLVALTALWFAISYIKFMREEIRST